MTRRKVVSFAKAKLHRIAHEMGTLFERITESRIEKARLYQEALDQRLYRAGGFADAMEWAEKELRADGLDRLAWDTEVLARFEFEIVRKSGLDKLGSLLWWCQLTGAPPPPPDPVDYPVRYRKGARWRTVSFGKLSVDAFDDILWSALELAAAPRGYHHLWRDRDEEGEWMGDALFNAGINVSKDLYTPQPPLPRAATDRVHELQSLMNDAVGARGVDIFAFWCGGELELGIEGPPPHAGMCRTFLDDLLAQRPELRRLVFPPDLLFVEGELYWWNRHR